MLGLGTCSDTDEEYRNLIKRQQADLEQLQKDLAQLEKDLAQLEKDLAQLEKDLAVLRDEVLRLEAYERGYKEKAKNEIENYVFREPYSSYDWEDICEIISEGINRIEEASSIAEVDIAVEETKIAIDEVPTEDEVSNLISIHYFSYGSFLPSEQPHKYYDFVNMTYSTRTIIVNHGDEWINSEVEYEVKATFTKEQLSIFYKNARKNGISDLDSYYSSNAFDGGIWYLTITLSDGAILKSRGYEKYPSQEKALDEAFLALSGYKLFKML